MAECGRDHKNNHEILHNVLLHLEPKVYQKLLEIENEIVREVALGE